MQRNRVASHHAGLVYERLFGWTNSDPTSNSPFVSFVLLVVRFSRPLIHLRLEHTRTPRLIDPIVIRHYVNDLLSLDLI